MPLPANNRIKGKPNRRWRGLKTLKPQQTVAFTDEDKRFIWVGMIANKHSSPPDLNGVQAAFWSPVENQPEAAFE